MPCIEVAPPSITAARFPLGCFRPGAPAAVPATQQPTIPAAANVYPDAAREAAPIGSLTEAIRKQLFSGVPAIGVYRARGCERTRIELPRIFTMLGGAMLD